MNAESTESSRTKSVAGFVVIALAAAALLAITHRLTAPAIEANRLARLIATSAPVLGGPGATRDLTPQLVLETTAIDGALEPVRIYAAKQPDGAPAKLYEISVLGYAGPIKLLVGIGTDQLVTGARVLEHRETPGLGDPIDREKSDWIEQFTDLGTAVLGPDDYAIRSDGGQFAGLTGASITPRAVIRGIAGVVKHANQRSGADESALGSPDEQ